jgi:hypothetical protein
MHDVAAATVIERAESILRKSAGARGPAGAQAGRR